MQIFRKSALVATAALFTFLLSTFVLSIGLWQAFSTPATLKHALSDSNLYKTVISDSLEQAKKEQGDEINLDDPDIKKVIVNSFPPSDLQHQTENALDNIYSWLQGSSTKLEFKFDLTQAKIRLADGLAQYVQSHLASLPECTAANMPAPDVDPLSLECRPAGIDINAQAEKAKQNILTGDFLKDNQLSSDTIKNEKGQTIGEQLKQAPTAYSGTKWGLIITAILSVITAAVIILLSTSRRAGIKRVSVVTIVTGGVIALSGWLLSLAVHHLSTITNQNAGLNDNLQQSMVHFLQLIVDDLRNWWMGVGLGFVVLGVSALLALRFTKPKDEIAEEKAEKDFTGNKNDDKPEDWAVKLSDEAKAKPKNSKAKTEKQ